MTRITRKSSLKWRAPTRGKNKGKIVAIHRGKIIYVVPTFGDFLSFKQGWDEAESEQRG